MKFDDVIEVSAMHNINVNKVASKIISIYSQKVHSTNMNNDSDMSDERRISKRTSILDNEDMECCQSGKKKKKKCKDCVIF